MAIKTLNELDQLRLSRFCRPKPRHGLRLLFWFAHEFIEFISNQMVATSHPNYGIFGFHRFYNWADNGDALLPPQSFDYYEVGNLNETNSWDFPEYVREDHTGWQDDSNTDRIIVGMDGCNVDRVYVTRHSDLRNFSRSDTCRISRGLINIIRRMSLEQFLSEMDPPKHSAVSHPGKRGPPKDSFVLKLADMEGTKYSSLSQSGNKDVEYTLVRMQSDDCSDVLRKHIEKDNCACMTVAVSIGLVIILIVAFIMYLCIR